MNVVPAFTIDELLEGERRSRRRPEVSAIVYQPWTREMYAGSSKPCRLPHLNRAHARVSGGRFLRLLAGVR